MTVANYLEFAKRLAAQTPLRSLRLNRLQSRMVHLAACPHLRSIATLILGDTGMDDADAAVLAESPHVAGLKTLDVAHNRLSAVGVEALLSSPHLHSCEMTFAWNLLGFKGGEVLGRHPGLARYTVLDLEGTGLSNEGLIALLSSPHLGQVTELRLRHCQIGDDGIRALVGANLPALRRLDLGGNYLGNAEVALLADSRLLGQLTHLDLGSNHIGNDGARALAGSAWLSGLQVLALSHNRISDQGAQALHESAHSSADLSLLLKGNPVSAEDDDNKFEDDDDDEEHEYERAAGASRSHLASAPDAELEPPGVVMPPAVLQPAKVPAVRGYSERIHWESGHHRLFIRIFKLW